MVLGESSQEECVSFVASWIGGSRLRACLTAVSGIAPETSVRFHPT